MTKKCFRIALINPPIGVKDVYGKYSSLASFQLPVGLCSLASYLIKNGYEVKIIDANVLGLSIDDVVKELRGDPVQLVGIYINTPVYYIAARLAAKIRTMDISLKIVVGGPHCTFLPADTLSGAPFDYCVIGEGEETLLELARHLEGNCDDLSGIDGLAFKTDDGRVSINRPRKRIEDLDRLPFPAVHLLPPLSNYKLYPLQYKRLPYMPMVTARGCPFGCVFCSTPFGKLVRCHSPEYVVDYIEFLSRQFGVKEVFFSDDTFSIDERRVYEMCALMRKRKVDVSWYANIHASIRDRDLFREMKGSGCWIVAVGVESGDQRILRLIGKNTSPEQISSVCRSVLASGLMLKTFFILGNPGDTEDTIDRTIDFALSLKAHYPVFSLMTPYPGTELWKKAEEYGTFDRSRFDRLLLASSDPVFIPYGLSKEILLNKQKEAFRKTYLNLGMIKRQLASIDSPEGFAKLFKAFLSFLKIQTN